MSVTDGDIKRRLSVPGATEGDDDSQADPNASLGEYMSTSAITDASIANLFPNVSKAEAGTGITRYRCFFYLNDGPGEDWEDVVVFVLSQIPLGATVAIGLDPTGITARDSMSAQAVDIADELTAPAGVTFAMPTTYESGLAVGTVADDECFAVWVRLTAAPNLEALHLDNVVIRAAGATEP